MMADEHYKPDWWDSNRARWYDEDQARKQREERAGALLVARDATLEGKEAAARKILASTPTHRVWQAKPFRETGAIELNAGASGSFERSVIMINPTRKRFHDGQSFVLWFGGCGATYLHVFCDSLEEAIEECAAWLADHMPGHIMKEWSDEHKELVKEACEELELEWPKPDDADDQAYWDAADQAESDLTRTESGFLTSYEWGIALENPTLDELYDFVFGD
jgi:hypothetical protein